MSLDMDLLLDDKVRPCVFCPKNAIVKLNGVFVCGDCFEEKVKEIGKLLGALDQCTAGATDEER